MKQELINGYVTDLSGITIGGVAVPVFDYMVPNSTDAKRYIIVSTYDATPDQLTKCGTSYNHYIMLDLVTKFDIGYGNRYFANLMRAEVINRVQAMGRVNKVQDTDNSFDTASETVFRNILRFEHKINKL